MSSQESLAKNVEKKRMLQEEISSLQSQREDLQMILEAHRSVCNKLNEQPSLASLAPRVVVKSEPEMDLSRSATMEAMLTSAKPERAERPVSLSLKTVPLRNIEGVSIDTPSNGISLNFDSLMEGRTGLTPTNVLAPININHTLRVRGGNKKYRALRLDQGNFSWPSEAVSRKTRIIDVVYNAANNELVRTKTLVKNAIVVIDAAPFRQW